MLFVSHCLGIRSFLFLAYTSRAERTDRSNFIDFPGGGFQTNLLQISSQLTRWHSAREYDDPPTLRWPRNDHVPWTRVPPAAAAVSAAST